MNILMIIFVVAVGFLSDLFKDILNCTCSLFYLDDNIFTFCNYEAMYYNYSSMHKYTY